MSPNRRLAGAFALALALGTSAAGCRGGDSYNEQAKQEAAIKELTIDEVQALIGKNELTVIDNNSESRFQKGHVPTAKWVKFNEVKASDLPADRDRKLVFYCSNES